MEAKAGVRTMAGGGWGFRGDWRCWFAIGATGRRPCWRLFGVELACFRSAASTWAGVVRVAKSELMLQYLVDRMGLGESPALQPSSVPPHVLLSQGTTSTCVS